MSRGSPFGTLAPASPPSRIRLLILFAFGALLLAACGGQNPSPVPTRPPESTSAAAADQAVVPTEAPPATTPPEEATNAASADQMTATAPAPAATRGRREPTAGATQPAVPTGEDQPMGAFDPDGVTLELERFADGLAEPLFITHAGDGSGRVFAVEKGGGIRTVPDGDLFLDIRDRVGSEGSEQGLLGLAFHPDFAENGYLYLNYTNVSGTSVVSRYTANEDRTQADPASEQVLLTQDQPAANHNGGMVAFGPDGYLYVGFGDGGGANDQYGNGQNMDTFLAKVLRLDVDGTGDRPYVVPETNPYVDRAGIRPEIWAGGLRNPWRFSFDRETGDLYIGDVGQGEYEEINFQPADSRGGENYGWPVLEGKHCFQEDDCDPQGMVAPVAEYTHDDGCSITGGYVYRGSAYPALRGAYVFGDYCSGLIWTLHRGENGEWEMTRMAETGLSISSFGEDEAGELYLTDLQEGTVYRVTGERR